MDLQILFVGDVAGMRWLCRWLERWVWDFILILGLFVEWLNNGLVSR